MHGICWITCNQRWSLISQMAHQPPPHGVHAPMWQPCTPGRVEGTDRTSRLSMGHARCALACGCELQVGSTRVQDDTTACAGTCSLMRQPACADMGGQPHMRCDSLACRVGMCVQAHGRWPSRSHLFAGPSPTCFLFSFYFYFKKIPNCFGQK